MNIIKVESRINGKSSKINGVVGLAVTNDLIGIEFGNIDTLVNAIVVFSTFGKLKIEVITGDTYFIEASTSVINVGMITLTDKMTAFREPLKDNLNPVTGKAFEPQDIKPDKDLGKEYKVPQDLNGDIAHALMFNTGKTKDGKTSSNYTASDAVMGLVETDMIKIRASLEEHIDIIKGEYPNSIDFIRREYWKLLQRTILGNLNYESESFPSDDKETNIGKSIHEVADEHANIIFNTLVQPGLVGLIDHIIVSEDDAKRISQRYYNTVGNLSFGAIGNLDRGTKEEI